MLKETDRKMLLGIARASLEEYIRDGRIYPVNFSGYPDSLLRHSGVFVSLHKNGKLRGCIGRFKADKPLYELVRDMSISASTRDFRFKPVKPGELEEIDLEISVLSEMVPVHDPLSEVKLGEHGIYIKKGPNSGTLLPHVATQTGWNQEEFLGHCARDKANIGWDGWRDAEVYIYEAEVFSETECS